MSLASQTLRATHLLLSNRFCSGSVTIQIRGFELNVPAPVNKDTVTCREDRGWPSGLPFPHSLVKRGFDVAGAILGLALTWWIILPAILAAYLDTGESGVFSQSRVGRRGKRFTVYKIRTMRSSQSTTTNVTTDDDIRITNLGRVLRRTKLDELPQLWNVLRGDIP